MPDTLEPLPDYDPTKQGLKQNLSVIITASEILPDYDPTKQGLKLVSVHFLRIVRRSSRLRSNKTRIETSYLTHTPLKPGNFQTTIQQNKD